MTEKIQSCTPVGLEAKFDLVNNPFGKFTLSITEVLRMTEWGVRMTCLLLFGKALSSAYGRGFLETFNKANTSRVRIII